MRQIAPHSRAMSSGEARRGRLDVADAVGLSRQDRPPGFQARSGAGVLAPVPAAAKHMASVGIDHLTVLRRVVRIFARLRAHIDKAVPRPGEAEDEIARRPIEIVAAKVEPGLERNHVVEVDKRIDLGQRLAGENPLDQPLGRGAIARALDPKPL